MTIKDTILAHLRKVGSISIREAMDDYSVSGGSLTKYITILKREGHTIHCEMRKHPITGRRYARYHLVDVYQLVPASTPRQGGVFNVGDRVVTHKGFGIVGNNLVDPDKFVAVIHDLPVPGGHDGFGEVEGVTYAGSKNVLFYPPKNVSWSYEPKSSGIYAHYHTVDAYQPSVDTFKPGTKVKLIKPFLDLDYGNVPIPYWDVKRCVGREYRIERVVNGWAYVIDPEGHYTNCGAPFDHFEIVTGARPFAEVA